MTDLYIATSTQADYDALMLLAEASGYMWLDGSDPSEFNAWKRITREDTAVLFSENKIITYDSAKRIKRNEYKIETIPNLANIKAIWKVKPKYKNAFNDEKLDSSDIFKDWALNDGVIILLKNGSYDLGFEEVYKALAVEYKPKESEDIMPEKVKLPKIIFDWLDNEIKQATMRLNVAQPFTTIAAILNEMNKKTLDSNLFWWINLPANQWKLIDALRYGYEAEPEPRWGIKAGNCYMDNITEWSFESIVNTSATLAEFDYFNDKAKADDLVKTLGFGEVVDLNKEV